jgi:hypothetical protein
MVGRAVKREDGFHKPFSHKRGDSYEGRVPDADLAIASLATVRQWIYKPYLLNGEPVDVDTQITVNFSFSP